MKILITGGVGFVGANLAVYFRQRKHFVMAMDNLSRRGSEFNLERLAKAGVLFRHGDVRFPDDFPGERFDVVLHCAAQPSVCPGYTQPLTDLQVNTVGTWNVLEYCLNYRSGLIFWSTNKVYPGTEINVENVGPVNEKFTVDGFDHSVYGLSKLCADLSVQEYASAFDMPALVNRCSCLYGPWQWGAAEQGWVAWFAAAVHLGLPIQIFGWNGEQVRDLLHIDDLCWLIENQIDELPGYRGEVFNVGGGPSKTANLKEVLDFYTTYFRKPEISVEVLEEPRRADHRIYVSDISKVRSAFKWEPTIDVEEGLATVADWVVQEEEALRWLHRQP